MRDAIRLARFEIHQRRFTVVVGVVAGLGAWAAPWVVGGTLAVHPPNLAVPLLLAIAFGAAVYGFTLFGPEMADKRIGFLLIRPVGASAVWIGKMAGSYAVIWITAVAMFLPPFLGGRFTFDYDRGFPTLWLVPSAIPGDAAMIAGVVAASLATGSVVGIVAHAASRWIVADVAGLSLLALAAGWAVATRGSAGARLLSLEAIAGGVALLAASAAGFVRHRGDLSGAHATMSKVLWTALLPVCAACSALAALRAP